MTADHSGCVSRDKYRALEAEVNDLRDLTVALERLLADRDATIARLTAPRRMFQMRGFTRGTVNIGHSGTHPTYEGAHAMAKMIHKHGWDVEIEDPDGLIVFRLDAEGQEQSPAQDERGPRTILEPAVHAEHGVIGHEPFGALPVAQGALLAQRTGSGLISNRGGTLPVSAHALGAFEPTECYTNSEETFAEGQEPAAEPVYRTGIQCPTGEHPVGTVCTHPFYRHNPKGQS